MRLNKLHWLSAVLVFALISGFVIHLMFPAVMMPEPIHYGLLEPVNSPTNDKASLKKKNSNIVENQQVITLTAKLAELQSHILRLNALGDRLASDANIPEKEYNFNQLPPSGGPVTYRENSSETRTQPFTKKSLSQLLVEISQLEGELIHEEKQLKMLESLSLGHYIENTRYLSGRPIAKGWLSSYFGIRKDPFNGRPAMHKGIDFAGKENTSIIATASGVVSWADDRYGYGQLIEIDHGDGLKTRYGHNKKILVHVGDVVSKGQVIAKMGSTGRSTGPHVHYEILRNNSQINPLKFVYRKGK